MADDPLSLKWSSGAREGTTVLELTGPLTLKNLFAFQNELAKVTSAVLIIDLAKSDYMDSAGLGALMRYFVSAEKRGGKLLLTNVNHRVAALLETTKVDSVLKSFATIEAAEASLR
jgi:anti-sigma B factor antagonist